MTRTTTLAALALAGLLLAGCTTTPTTPDCDLDDLLERDPDCGFPATPTSARPTPKPSASRKGKNR